MSAYTLLPRAERDLQDIWEFIAGDYYANIDTADQFIDRIEDSLYNLAEYPFMGYSRPELANNLRSFPADDYIIFYRPTEAGIEVARIVHGSRDIRRLF